LPSQFYDAIEISAHDSWRQLQQRFGDFTYVTASDSHYLDTIGQVYTEFNLTGDHFSCDVIKACLGKNRCRMVKNAEIRDRG
ncbi:MAG: PHP-associated domain-containing protein, partial [Chitinivibrionales bacterium]